MSNKKKEPEKIILSELKPDELLKYEIATELGLLDTIMQTGWKSLSAKDTGRIGGIMTKRRKQMRTEVLNKP